MTAEYKVDGAIAVITLNNPPVNGLGLSTRRGIVEGLDKAYSVPAVKAIVITGAGKAFSGGADINEFGKEEAYREPHLVSLINSLDQGSKPVVAAIHTVCMGGGLELALCCDMRLAILPHCLTPSPSVVCNVGIPSSSRIAVCTAAFERSIGGTLSQSYAHLSAQY